MVRSGRHVVGGKDLSIYLKQEEEKKEIGAISLSGLFTCEGNTDTLTKSHKGAKAAASGEERAWKWRVAKDGPACSMTVSRKKSGENKNTRWENKKFAKIKVAK